MNKLGRSRESCMITFRLFIKKEIHWDFLIVALVDIMGYKGICSSSPRYCTEFWDLPRISGYNWDGMGIIFFGDSNTVNNMNSECVRKCGPNSIQFSWLNFHGLIFMGDWGTTNLDLDTSFNGLSLKIQRNSYTVGIRNHNPK